MNPPLYKFQQEIANDIAKKFLKSERVSISIPCGYGKSVILAEVARLLQRPCEPLPVWNECAYHLAYYKYIAIKEVQECLEIGNEEAKKRRALSRAKIESMRRIVREKDKYETNPKLRSNKHRR